MARFKFKHETNFNIYEAIGMFVGVGPRLRRGERVKPIMEEGDWNFNN